MTQAEIDEETKQYAREMIAADQDRRKDLRGKRLYRKHTVETIRSTLGSSSADLIRERRIGLGQAPVVTGSTNTVPRRDEYGNRKLARLASNRAECRLHRAIRQESASLQIRRQVLWPARQPGSLFSAEQLVRPRRRILHLSVFGVPL